MRILEKKKVKTKSGLLMISRLFSFKYQPPFASSDTNPDWPQEHLNWLFVQGKLNLTSLLRFPNDRAGCFLLS